MASLVQSNNFPSVRVRKFLALSFPLVLTTATYTAMEIIDAIMLGRYSQLALAAWFNAATIIFMLLLPALGFYHAIISLTSKKNGNLEYKTTRSYKKSGSLFSILYAFFMMPIFVFSEPLLEIMGVQSELAQESGAYLAAYAIGLIPVLLVRNNRAILVAMANTRAISIAIGIGAIVNIVLNYILIYGSFGAPELGVVGAAAATVIANFLTYFLLEWYLRNKCEVHDVKLTANQLAFYLKKITKLGAPISATSFFETGQFYVLTLIVSLMGATQMAAHAIAFQIVVIVYGVYSGLINATIAFIGEAFGKKSRPIVNQRYITVMYISISAAIFGAISILVFPNFYIWIFVGRMDIVYDSELSTLLHGLIWLTAIFVTFDCIEGIAAAAAAAVQKTVVPMWINIFSKWLVGLPFAYIIAIELENGLFGIWFGFTAGAVLSGAAHLVYISNISRFVPLKSRLVISNVS